MIFFLFDGGYMFLRENCTVSRDQVNVLLPE